MKYLLLSKANQPKIESGFQFFDENSDYILYFNKDLFRQFGDTGVLIDGYLVPRNGCFAEWNNNNPFELIYKLYEKYGKEFVGLIKGIFTIVIVEKENVFVFNDHLGLNKSFIYENDSRIILSDDYKALVSIIENPAIDYNAIAINSLFHHFLNGDTFLKQVKYLKGSARFNISEGRLKKDYYWDYKSLMNDIINPLSFEESASIIKTILSQYYSYLAPEKLALSLTGGKDCRTILAGLLSQELSPYTFTYGDKNSKDAYYAEKIAEGQGLDYEVISPPKSKEWLEDMYDQIIQKNDPLINLHRAHRLHSFSKLKSTLGGSSMLFGEYMGGEILMGLYYDDLIFSPFLRKHWQENIAIDKLTEEYLDYNYINSDKIQKEELISRISKFSFINEKNIRKQHFHAAFEIGFLHHSQDINLAMKEMQYAVPLFMDIDFLELIFQSRFNLLHQDNITTNIYKRYKLFDFNLNIQHLLYPDLDQYNFAKRGYFNTKEFLGNKTKLSFLRAMRYYTDRQQFSPTYTYEDDYVGFIDDNLRRMEKPGQDNMNNLFKLKKALNGIENKKYGTQEKNWHRYSNIVMMDKFISHYMN